MTDSTHPPSGTSTSITSLGTTSSQSQPSSATPIIVGAVIASVLIVIGLISISFWIRRRRTGGSLFRNPNRETIYNTTNDYHYPTDPKFSGSVSLHTVSKHDFLPPEPEAPPPYSKDGVAGADKEVYREIEKDANIKPPTPPKEFGKPFIKVRGSSEDYDVEAARLSDDHRYVNAHMAIPSPMQERQWPGSRVEGDMF